MRFWGAEGGRIKAQGEVTTFANWSASKWAYMYDRAKCEVSNMDLLNHAIRLLGMSEGDPEVGHFLNALKVNRPLRRPRRDEDQINVVIADGASCSSNDMVLHTVFLHRFGAGMDGMSTMPFGLNMDLSRASMRERLGAPDWSSPLLNNDRWIIDNLRVLACFSEDENSIDQLAFSLDDQGQHAWL